MRLLYFAPVPWASYPQRPHFMVRFFVERHGAHVLWVNPYPSRLPRWADRHRPLPARAERSVLHSLGVATLDVPALPIEPLPGGSFLNERLLWRGVRRTLTAFASQGPIRIGVGRPSTLSTWALAHLPAADSFYDRMDDYAEFYTGLSRRRTKQLDAAVARAVRRVFVSSTGLEQSLPALTAPPVIVPNACDMRDLPAPSCDRVGPAVVGYVGTIASWFDWRVVGHLAESLPDVEVRLVGPCYAPPPRALPPNVVTSPACSREAALREMQSFSAGLIPFRATALTRGVDPIKYYEYRAMGLPVLTTRFGEMARRGQEPTVHFVDERTDWTAVWSTVTRRPTAEEVLRFREHHDWNRRFEVVFPVASGGWPIPSAAEVIEPIGRA